jgi:hypothetical protein
MFGHFVIRFSTGDPKIGLPIRRLELPTEGFIYRFEDSSYRLEALFTDLKIRFCCFSFAVAATNSRQPLFVFIN